MNDCLMELGTGYSEGGTAGSARPLISIAMCTYNGDAYVCDQLDSFLGQTQQPDELVVCDDGSADNTLQILEQFTEEAPFPVRVYQNEQRLGATKNFERALRLCKGDFVFLSDQDDVWLPQKVAMLSQALRSDPDAGYVFSDALVVDEMLRPLGYTMWQSIGFTQAQRRRFSQGRQLGVLLKHNVVTGATMAFRAEPRSIILPIPSESVHDEWIALLASSSGMHGVIVQQPLVKYRQHPEQLLGGRKVSFVGQGKEAALTRGEPFESRLHHEEVKCSQALHRLALRGKVDKRVRQLFDAKIEHIRVRQCIHNRPRRTRLLDVGRECLTLRYNRFSFGWKSIARDLLL
jgi:hypothetical protein